MSRKKQQVNLIKRAFLKGDEVKLGKKAEERLQFYRNNGLSYSAARQNVCLELEVGPDELEGLVEAVRTAEGRTMG